MRRRGHMARAALLIAALWAALALPAAAQERPLAALEGSSLEASELEKGSWIVVAWASWSPRCRDIVPRVNELARDYGRRARVITVNFQEEPETVRAFLAGQRLEAPVYLDGDAAFSKKHAITSLPGVLVLVDGRRTFGGRLPREPKAMLDRALERRPSAPE